METPQILTIISNKPITKKISKITPYSILAIILIDNFLNMDIILRDKALINHYF
jgi:hypothetical protein